MNSYAGYHMYVIIFEGVYNVLLYFCMIMKHVISSVSVNMYIHTLNFESVFKYLQFCTYSYVYEVGAGCQMPPKFVRFLDFLEESCKTF